MKLDNFELKHFDFNNLDMREAIVKLDNDLDVKKNIGYVNMYIEYAKKSDNGIDEFYMVYNNDAIIGFITLFEVSDKFEICYAILPEYRKQYLASLLLQEFSERVFDDYPFINEIKLQINPSNMASRKTAEMVGYTKENITRYSMHR